MSCARISATLIALIFVASPVFAKSSGGNSGGSHTVKSYTKKDGTHVESHRATNPDGTKLNNYSTKGNTNPYKGEEGTKDPSKK